MVSIEYIIKKLEVYSCNHRKNKECRKAHCNICGGPCYHTTEWKYAKKTPLNYIKRLIKSIKNNCL